jgi:drug/metabolite transporter, DME family
MSYGRGAIMVVVGAVLWSLMGLAIRQLDVAGTWQVLFWRSAGMMPVFLLIVAFRSNGRVLQAIRQAGLPAVLGGASLVLAFAGAIYALQTTTIANATFLFAATPLFTAILGRLLLAEAVKPATWMAIVLAGLGILLMVREGLAIGTLAGNLSALGSALGFALFTLTLRWGRQADMMPAGVLGSLFAMLTALIVLVFRGEPIVVPLDDTVIALAMGVALVGIGTVLFTLGSRVVPAAELSILALVEVLLAPIWVWLFLNETASQATFVGGGIVLVAVVLNALSGARRRATV